jgi:phosphoribosylformylglycinamidine synthase subunit PurQ / glutaminase
MLTEKEPLNVAVVRFPGSNCDDDSLRFFRRFGHNASYLWYKETEIPEGTNLVFLPGGFAFGDRVYESATGHFVEDPGKQALKTPIMGSVYEWADQEKLIWGVCNGFQILVHAGLLPGELARNESDKFFCDDVDVRVEGRSFAGDQSMLGNIYQINVAHGYGNYKADSEILERLNKNGQIYLRYHGFNPNGSIESIAGICNMGGNIFGQMPHPERADLETQKAFMEAIEKNVRT